MKWWMLTKRWHEASNNVQFMQVFDFAGASFCA
jgi:hypothetical protein